MGYERQPVAAPARRHMVRPAEPSIRNAPTVQYGGDDAQTGANVFYNGITDS